MGQGVGLAQAPQSQKRKLASDLTRDFVLQGVAASTTIGALNVENLVTECIFVGKGSAKLKVAVHITLTMSVPEQYNQQFLLQLTHQSEYC